MIIYKTQKETEVMAQGGKLLAEVLETVSKKVEPGIGTKELDDVAEKLIKEIGGQPAFKNYKGSGLQIPFPTTLCTSINEEIVHAPAIPNRILKQGDIIGLDIGMQYKGLFTDMAVTVPVGKIDEKAEKLLRVTKEALFLAIEQFKEGNNLSDLAFAIQRHASNNGFAVVRELVGHGVGKSVHEDPRVPNYVTEESMLIPLKRGMTLALEPMMNIGGWKIDLLDDGLTFATSDSSLSAQFEHTVALDHNGKTRILTKFSDE